MPIPLCIVCAKPAPCLYGDLQHMPICRECHGNGALTDWLAQHPQSNPDDSAYDSSLPVGTLQLVGNDRDGLTLSELGDACLRADRESRRSRQTTFTRYAETYTAYTYAEWTKAGK